jgi:hypothetical protein
MTQDLTSSTACGVMAGADNMLFLLGYMVTLSLVGASIPDLISNLSEFTFTGFRNLQFPPAGLATLTFADVAKVPGLIGTGLSEGVLQFAEKTKIDPYYHGLAAEIVYVTSGPLDVGFVDSNNTLLQTTLSTGNFSCSPRVK